MDRRLFLLAIPGLLAACTTTQTGTHTWVNTGPSRSNLKSRYTVSPHYRRMYSAVTTEPYPVPAVDLSRIDPKYLRHEVNYTTPYAPGTLVVDPARFFCYFILPEGKAIRYGVGVARNQSTNFRGQGSIGRKAEWPYWTPTRNMMRTQPKRYGHLGGGLKPGVTNPLGARALYLYRNGRDTLFRLHGTIEPWSIGTNVSSGCIRFLNQDIIDLYERVKPGARVVVLQG